ncbi:hypothetical protein T439DRAFT_356985 [Meredithblackwellia eburnea MCA 4105]
MPKSKIRISAVDNPAEQPICGICKTQQSRYTCPHCNLHYCSIACFRSQTHSSCSESFDRRGLTEEIRSAEDKTMEEKQAMMDMLKRFEEQSAEMDEDEDSDEDDLEDEEREALEKKLEGLDLDSMSPEDVLALLSPTQRAAFEQTLSDPVKVTALVSAEFQNDSPWWSLSEEESQKLDVSVSESGPRKIPDMVDVSLLPPLKMGPDGQAAGQQLLYNLVAILQALIYRTTSIDMLSQLVPFLMEKSTTVIQDSGGAIEYVLSREKLDTLTPELIQLILHDLETLLRPSPISVVDRGANALSSHPSHLTLRALSDLQQLFDSSKEKAATTSSQPDTDLSKRKPIRPVKTLVQGGQKLLFYAAIVKCSENSQTLGAIGRTLGLEARRRAGQGGARKEATREIHEDRKEAKESANKPETPKIVELTEVVTPRSTALITPID